MRDSTTVEVQAIASEIKTLRRGGGSDNLAEAVAKLCVELDHVTKESVPQTVFQTSLGELRRDMEEQLRKRLSELPEDRRFDREDFRELRDEIKELKTRVERLEEQDSDLARRRFSEECAQKIGSLKEELEQHRQSGRQSERHLRQEWKSGLGSLNEKVEALRLDLGAAKEKLSVRPREFRDDQKLQNAMQEITELGNDLYELKRQVKQQSVDLLKRRDTQDDLVENAGLRVTGLEEQVRSMKLQVAQLLHLREKVSKLSNWQQGEASSSVEERMAQLEGRLQAQSRKSSPSRSPRQEESLWAKQVAVISAQQERNCEQLAIFEEKLTNLWTLTPRICQLEDQQKDFWRLQE
ncbi:unnamed protein product, partial [Durusdinium trenchii]